MRLKINQPKIACVHWGRRKDGLNQVLHCLVFALGNIYPTPFRHKEVENAPGQCVLCCFSCLQLFATLWTVAHQAPLFMGILQARILDWVAFPISSRPRDQTWVFNVSCIGRQVPYHSHHLGSPDHIYVGIFMNFLYFQNDLYCFS